MSIRIEIILLTFLGFVYCLAYYGDVFVEIDQGILKGSERVDRYGRAFYSFRSIPYAEPPVGALRFMPPVPAQGWTGIRDATQDLPICYQANSVGTEDCLYLNVFTRHLTSKKTPVMVFFHGGGYVLGNAREELYNAELLLTQDIVLVTAAYRLGMLGFLSLGMNAPNSVAANAGMKDQVMVLNWVKQNIEYFGGSPESVTLFGESAGASCVHLHLFSPMSKGLFHRVIIESGSALLPWSIGRNGSGEALAEELSITSTDPVQILRELQNLTPKEINDAQQSLLGSVEIYKEEYSSPIVEKNSALPLNNFLPEHPKALLQSNNYSNVPILTGYNDKEGILWDILNKINGEYLHLYDLKYLIPHDLQLDGNEQAIAEIVALLEDHYFDGLKPVPEVDAMKLIDVITDTWFLYGILQSVKMHVENLDTVFFYKFSSDTKLNYYKRLLPVTALYEGASHIDELGYIFKTLYTPEYDEESIEDYMIAEMVTLWTNFAWFGHPTPNASYVDWSQVLPKITDAVNYLHIKTGEMVMEQDPERERMLLWDTIYETYGNNL